MYVYKHDKHMTVQLRSKVFQRLEQRKLKMCKLIIIFLIFISVCSAKEENCKNLESELSQKQHVFLSCAVHNYSPLKFDLCEHCSLQNTDMIQTFDLMHANCNETGDPFKILISVHTVYTKLWSQANCDKCPSSNNSHTTATYFVNNFTDFQNCFHGHDPEPCVFCRFKYEHLKILYSKMEMENNGKVCYDLQSRMNKARTNWSQKCQRQSDLFLFFIPAALVLCLTVAFYGTNIWITKRQERSNELLYNTDAEVRNRENNAALNGHTAITQAQPSGIIEAEILAIDPPLKHSNIDKESDDDSYYSDDAPMLL